MFGRRKNDIPDADPRAGDTGGGRDAGDSTPEGQAGYIPIDDTSDLPLRSDMDDPASATDEMLAALRAELDEANDKWKRSLADFQNYQRRAHQNEQEARKQAISSVVMSVVPVLDHFDLALNQKADGSAAGILEGVKVIRAELIRALEKNGVRVINPAPNDPFDPMRHEAIMQQATEGIEPGHISSTFQPGFEYGDRVIRSAKVAVAPA